MLGKYPTGWETEQFIITSISALIGETCVGVNHAHSMIPAALLPAVAQHIRTHRLVGWLSKDP